jgi:hypothetical protein
MVSCEEILAALSESQLELFKRTKLYAHFSGKTILLETDISQLRLRYMAGYVINFNIVGYDGGIEFNTFKSKKPFAFIMFVTGYLNASIRLSSYKNTNDIRYFENHREDLYTEISSTNLYSLGDYIYWLMQGNSPRVLRLINRFTPDIVPDGIIYLMIECRCASKCKDINIPDSVLFLDYECSLKVDPSRFISCRRSEPYEKLSAFRKYIFGTRNTKRALKTI